MPMSRRPAVFLDRDGTIIEDVHYLAEPEQVQLIPGAAAAIQRLNQAGFRVIVVTNQAGVALGRFPEDRVEAVHTRLSALLAESQAVVDGYFFCPHHPQGIVVRYSQVCRCRKPEAGMLFAAAQAFDLDLEHSWMIGDKVSDLAAGAAAGCQTILVRTGHGHAVTEPLSATAYRLAGIAPDLGHAVNLGPCRNEMLFPLTSAPGAIPMTRWTHPVTQQTVGYDDRGRGVPVVLLHAFPQSREMWAPQLTALSDQFRIIAPDLPGFGGSSLPHDGWTVESAADWIADFLLGIGIGEPVVLGGLSMGGYVALAFARRHPDRLRGLILADTRAEADGPDARANRESAITLAETQGTAAVFAGMLPKALGATTHQHRQAVVAEATRIAHAQSSEAVVAAIRALRDRPDAGSSLPVLTMPTLVIVGEEDTITPPDVARCLAGSLPAAQLAILPGAGHLSNLETPELFNDAIRAFLERLG